VRLDFSAISDVGRVRKDNQDSGYVGSHLITVCDGVGGAARGDVASSTVVTQLRKLEDAPPSAELSDNDLLGTLSMSLHRAHDKIAELVDENPALDGTSTTATVGLFDGTRLGMAHVGDSRAYLFREGALRQLTHDHTFVQTLIDEGRITEAEARVHPHKNLILRAIDGIHDLEPDLFVVPLQAGDRLFFCSDGACGVLDDGRLADILSSGSPDFAAVELVRASLEAGSSDNVTCLVADVLDGDPDDPSTALTPMVVGAATDVRRRPRAGQTRSLFRGHRSGDTGELEPIAADLPDLPSDIEFAIPSDPVDPETARYAPRPPRRFFWLGRVLWLLVLVGVLWVVAAAAWSWSQSQFYVGEDDGAVVIYRGIDASLPGIQLSTAYERTDVELDRLSDYEAGRVTEGIGVGSLDDAHDTVDTLASKMEAGS
jgi:PPM family protein phosphatase